MKRIAIGREFGNMLVQEFGLPETTSEININIRANEPVRITCKFIAVENKLERVIEVVKSFVVVDEK